MTKQQLLGWKRGPTNNNNKAVPDFGDLMNADCAMVEVQADMDISDAPTFPGVPKEKAEGRPLSPGAILEKAEQDAKKVNIRFCPIFPKHPTNPISRSSPLPPPLPRSPERILRRPQASGNSR